MNYELIHWAPNGDGRSSCGASVGVDGSGVVEDRRDVTCEKCLYVRKGSHSADRVIGALLGHDVLITQEGRERLIEIASRENIITQDVLDRIALRQEALAARAAAKMDGSDGVTKRDGIALIDVTGPITRYANIFSDISGGVSISALAKDFTAALDNPRISGILLRFDTPGGEAKGVNEMANMIVEARARKPIGGYVEVAGSAGYWLASAVTPGLLWSDEAGYSGSIGARVSMSKPRENSNSVEAVSDISPKKVIDPTTEDGLAMLKQRANDLATIFAASVARNRGMSVDAVAATQGQMLMGDQAVTAGLVDQIGSFEGLLAVMKDMKLGDAPPKPIPKPAIAITAAEQESGTVTVAAEEEGDNMPEPSAQEKKNLLTTLTSLLRLDVPNPQAAVTADAAILAENQRLTNELARRDADAAAVADAALLAENQRLAGEIARRDAEAAASAAVKPKHRRIQNDNRALVNVACGDADLAAESTADDAAVSCTKCQRAMVIEAEADTFVTTKCSGVGKDYTAALRRQFIAAKLAGSAAAVTDVESLAVACTPNLTVTRVEGAGADGGPTADQIAAKVLPMDEASIGREAVKRTKAKGIQPSSPKWNEALGAQVAAIRTEMKAGEHVGS